jgi:Protein of unknown function (DUF1579)
MGHSACWSLNVRLTVAVLVLMAAAWAQAADPAIDAKPLVPPLLQKMEGNWTVSEKMWPGSGQEAVDLPAATAHRRLIQKSFLEEVMEPAQAGASDSFNRTSYFEFNSTTHKFEYFSLDSRLPQMMNERSAVVNPSLASDSGVKLDGGHFVAPTWGQAPNVPFRYRLVVGDLKGDRQTVQLFLTPESGIDRKEFLAFEYLYVRAP